MSSPLSNSLPLRLCSISSENTMDHSKGFFRHNAYYPQNILKERGDLCYYHCILPTKPLTLNQENRLRIQR
ncbi:hypothetical protein SDJN03_21727, partial [Cucurbita argyrosperma subsp. sororia]